MADELKKNPLKATELRIDCQNRTPLMIGTEKIIQKNQLSYLSSTIFTKKRTKISTTQKIKPRAPLQP